jgi:hypothetical protein
VADDWQLFQFMPKLEEWAAQEAPSGDLRSVVANWVIDLHVNPYADLKPQRGFPELWFCGIPEAETPDGRAQVTCTVQINPIKRTVTCLNIATLSLPLDLDPEPLIDPDEPIE